MTPKQFCEKYLKKYTINPDNTINVNGSAGLCKKLGDMKKLPVKFGKVLYSFDCSENKLTTLDGCPKYVGGNFYCYGNNLTTVEGCPKYVGGDLVCEIITHHILGNVQRNIYCNNIQRIVI